MLHYTTNSNISRLFTGSTTLRVLPFKTGVPCWTLLRQIQIKTLKEQS